MDNENNFQINPAPEPSSAEKEARFWELLKRKEQLVAAFQEALEKGLPVDDDMFMEAEMAVEKAAMAAIEAGNQAEYERLMTEHETMMRWRFLG